MGAVNAPEVAPGPYGTEGGSEGLQGGQGPALSPGAEPCVSRTRVSTQAGASANPSAAQRGGTGRVHGEFVTAVLRVNGQQSRLSCGITK